MKFKNHNSGVGKICKLHSVLSPATDVVLMIMCQGRTLQACALISRSPACVIFSSRRVGLKERSVLKETSLIVPRKASI